LPIDSRVSTNASFLYLERQGEAGGRVMRRPEYAHVLAVTASKQLNWLSGAVTSLRFWRCPTQAGSADSLDPDWLDAILQAGKPRLRGFPGPGLNRKPARTWTMRECQPPLTSGYRRCGGRNGFADISGIAPEGPIESSIDRRFIFPYRSLYAGVALCPGRMETL